MSVVNTDANSKLAKTPQKCLQEVEWANKKMYLEACLQQHWDFSSFVASVNGLIGVEATDNLKRTSIRLVTKWWGIYSRTC